VTAAVNVNRTDFLANARKGWGDALPDWIDELARQCVKTSASEVAKRLGYSVAVVSGAVLGTYKGDLGKIEAKVRGLFMGLLVDCPVASEISRDRCIDEQNKKHIGGSAMRAKFLRACRTCEFSRTVQRQEERDAA
jgi:hypothetical protein